MEYFNLIWLHWNNPEWSSSFKFLSRKKSSCHCGKFDDLVSNFHFLEKDMMIICRMDCVYRLLYSMIAVHFRNYILTYSLFHETYGRESVRRSVQCWDCFISFTNNCFECQVCLGVSILPTCCLVGSMIHLAGTTLIRYLFVRSSLDHKTQIMMKKGHFVAVAFILPQVRKVEHGAW